jgi:hypothetical protein
MNERESLRDVAAELGASTNRSLRGRNAETEKIELSDLRRATACGASAPHVALSSVGVSELLVRAGRGLAG